MNDDGGGGYFFEVHENSFWRITQMIKKAKKVRNNVIHSAMGYL